MQAKELARCELVYTPKNKGWRATGPSLALFSLPLFSPQSPFFSVTLLSANYTSYVVDRASDQVVIVPGERLGLSIGV